jgi:LysR family transcriptional regulator, glycine cleavage system transcriptional activator
MPDLPPLSALQAFEATARRLSVRDASEELRVTPSAVSHRLRNLETAIGVKLFHRLNRQLILTDAGSVYLSRVAPAFDALRSATSEIAERGSADTLTLTAPPSFAEIWLLPRLSRFLSAHPDIDLRVEASSRAVDFSREPVDASIRYGRGDWPGLVARKLVEEQLVAVCAPSLQTGTYDVTEPGDLARHTLIHSDQRLTSWTAWLRSHGHGTVKGDRNLRFSQSAHSLRAAADGLGVALESRIMAAAYLDAGTLVEPFPDLAPADDGAAYHLVVPPDRSMLPKVRALDSWLTDEAGSTSI